MASVQCENNSRFTIGKKLREKCKKRKATTMRKISADIHNRRHLNLINYSVSFVYHGPCCLDPIDRIEYGCAFSIIKLGVFCFFSTYVSDQKTYYFTHCINDVMNARIQCICEMILHADIVCKHEIVSNSILVFWDKTKPNVLDQPMLGHRILVHFEEMSFVRCLSVTLLAYFFSITYCVECRFHRYALWLQGGRTEKKFANMRLISNANICNQFNSFRLWYGATSQTTTE